MAGIRAMVECSCGHRLSCGETYVRLAALGLDYVMRLRKNNLPKGMVISTTVFFRLLDAVYSIVTAFQGPEAL